MDLLGYKVQDFASDASKSTVSNNSGVIIFNLKVTIKIRARNSQICNSNPHIDAFDFSAY